MDGGQQFQHISSCHTATIRPDSASWASKGYHGIRLGGLLQQVQCFVDAAVSTRQAAHARLFQKQHEGSQGRKHINVAAMPYLSKRIASAGSGDSKRGFDGALLFLHCNAARASQRATSTGAFKGPHGRHNHRCIFHLTLAKCPRTRRLQIP